MSFLQDLRFSIRMLLRRPLFTLSALVCLALGLGGATAVFSVTNAVLLHPLPYKEPERLMMLPLFLPWMADFGYLHNSGPNYLDFKARSKTFETIAAYHALSGELIGPDSTVAVSGLSVTPNLLPMLDLKPLLGRVLAANEQDFTQNPIVILGYDLWQKQFGGDPQIIGKTINLKPSSMSIDSRITLPPLTVVGIMPAGVRFLPSVMGRMINLNFNQPVDFWIPTEGNLQQMPRGNLSWDILGRLKTGVDQRQAQAEMDTLNQQINKENGGFDPKSRIVVQPLLRYMTLAERPVLLLLLGAMGFVLAIAGINVASLLLVQGMARRREMALRAALGAGARRLGRLCLTEVMLLTVAGALLGLGLSCWAIDGITILAPKTIPRLDQIRLDPVVLGFFFASVLTVGVAIACVPVLRIVRQNVNEVLKEGGRGATAGRNRQRSMKALIVAQIAFTFILLAGSGLVTGSFVRLLGIDPGFAIRRDTLAIKMNIPQNANKAALLSQIQQRVAPLPGVQAVAMAQGLPLTAQVSCVTNAECDPPASDPTRDPGPNYVRVVTPGYFRMLGIPLIHGREFTEQDGPDSKPVVIINERLAKALWPRENPIGRSIKAGGYDNQMREIVGVIRDIKSRGLDLGVDNESYAPAFQNPSISMNNLSLLIQCHGDPRNVLPSIRAAMRSLDKGIVVGEERTMREIQGDSLAVRRFAMVLIGLFAAMALILTVVGLYGVLASAAAQRTHEIGVRVALGAGVGDVLRLVLAQGIRLTLAGLALGLVGALGLGRLLASQLYGVKPSDPWTLVAAALLLGSTALAACWIPARRAARINPMDALRCE